MGTFDYLEIDQLNEVLRKYKISVQPRENTYLGNDKNYPGILFKVGKETFDLYVYDEYSDLNKDNQLLCLFLALSELDHYADAEDYLQWCKETHLDASNEQARSYHINLRMIYADIAKTLRVINPFISNLDFELNSGAAEWLRKYGESVK